MTTALVNCPVQPVPQPLAAALRACLGPFALRPLAAAGALALALSTPLGALADTYTVTTLDDSGPGSLRQAVLDTNARAGADEIVFASTVSGTITLTSGPLVTTDMLTLTGPGAAALTLDGGGGLGVLSAVNDRFVGDLTVSGLTLTNANGPPAITSYSSYGSHIKVKDCVFVGNRFGVIGAGSTYGCIYLEVDDSIIADNDGGIGTYGWGGCGPSRIRNCVITGNRGGPILYVRGNGITISDSTISGNNSYYDRVVSSGYDVPIEIVRSLISGNDVSAVRGGFNSGSVLIDSSTITGNRGAAVDRELTTGALTILNSTITGNGVAGVGPLGRDPDETGPVRIVNSIVAGNGPGSGADLTGPDRFDVSYSLIQAPGDVTITEAVAGSNLFDTDPLLGPLADHGGPTLTQAPLPGSPVLDRGDPNFSPPPGFDQRGPGYSRVVGGRLDLGAAEVQVDEAPWLQPLGDINGDGTPEIAVVSRVEGTARATVKDAATGALISQVVFSDAMRSLVGVETLPAVNPGRGPNLVLLGASPAQAETRNPLTGDLFGTVRFDRNPSSSPVGLAVLPDQDGNGVQGLAALVTATSRLVAADQVTERVSVDSNGGQGRGGGYEGSRDVPAISADGRFVVFESYGSNFVPGDTNYQSDVFVHDRVTGATERVSVDSNGVQGDYGGSNATISADGRFVAFASFSNLVPGATGWQNYIYIHDRESGVTELVSVDSNGVSGNDNSESPAISADGRFVVFESYSSNLVPGDTNHANDIFIHDRVTRVTERVVQGTYRGSVSISADGRVIAFTSDSSNLVPGDTNNATDVFIHDRVTGATERVSVDSNGVQGNGSSDHWSRVAISADGRFIAFVSDSSNLVPGDTNNATDAFIHDRVTGATERVSVDSNGVQGNGYSGTFSGGVAISADSRFVVFQSLSSNLVPGDTNNVNDTFIRDRVTGTTERVSVGSCGTQGAGTCAQCGNDSGGSLAISADGRFVAFVSGFDNLVPDDTNQGLDIFVRGPAADTSAPLCPVPQDATEVEVRDAATGTLFNTLSFAAQFEPRQVVALPDLNGNGSAEVGVVLSDPAKADRLVINDTRTGAAVQTLRSGADLLQAAVVADRNGNGAPEVALLWRDPAAGDTRVWVVDAATNQRVASLAGFGQGYDPLKLAVVADLNGNGVDDYAVLGRNAATGQVAVSVQEGATNRWLNRFWYDKACTPLDLASIADIDHNGAAELVMLGRCGADGQLRAVVTDARTGQVLNRLTF